MMLVPNAHGYVVVRKQKKEDEAQTTGADEGQTKHAEGGADEAQQAWIASNGHPLDVDTSWMNDSGMHSQELPPKRRCFAHVLPLVGQERFDDELRTRGLSVAELGERLTAQHERDQRMRIEASEIEATSNPNMWPSRPDKIKSKCKACSDGYNVVLINGICGTCAAWLASVDGGA